MSRALLIELDDWAALYAENRAPMLVAQGHSISPLDIAEALMMCEPTEFINVFIAIDDPVFIYELGDPMREHRWRFPNELTPKQFNYFCKNANAYRVEKNNAS